MKKDSWLLVANSSVARLFKIETKKELLVEAHQNLFQSKQEIALLEEVHRRRYQKTNFNKSNSFIFYFYLY